MSVPRAQRNESEMEFLHTARTLVVYTLRKCNKIPKRFTFSVSNKLTETTWNVLSLVKQGNSIYPTNKHEVQLRRDCFLKARAELFDLTSKLEVAAEIASIDAHSLHEWCELVYKELALLKGVLDADKQRYKSMDQV